ncbi:phage late control D family protein [Paracoccus sp. P2]|uniref:phage late control D family protein n=1 Tax=Paracoccus sp. P2 TaxID=3248840 RepID=UPI00391F3753
MMVPQAKWILTYQGADIGADAISVIYTDFDHGKSDEIEATFEDKLHRWKGGWYPEHGDVLDLSIGWLGQGLLPCGTFEIDEIDFDGAPDTVTIRGLAAPVSESLRTKKTRAFENKTLRQIAEQIAGENGLSVEGTIENITFKRVTQDNERDLEFLKRIAEEYHHVFAVRGKVLFFSKVEDLESQGPVAVIPRTEMKRFSFQDKVHEVYKDCKLSYHDPETAKLIEVTVEDPNVKTGDTLRIKARVESEAQAKKRAEAELKKANAKKLRGRILIVGDHRMVAGNVIEVAMLGKLSGKYYVETSRHRIERGAGYTTEIEVRRVP